MSQSLRLYPLEEATDLLVVLTPIIRFLFFFLFVLQSLLRVLLGVQQWIKERGQLSR